MINIPYQIIRTRKNRTVSISIRPNNTVIVRAPHFISGRKIEEIIQKKSEWIFKHLKRQKEAVNAFPLRSFESGEKIQLGPHIYELKIEQGVKGRIVLANNLLTVTVPHKLEAEYHRDEIAWRVLEFSRTQAEKIIRERVSVYSGLQVIKPKQVRLKNLKSQWGNCSSRGTLTFNWKLILAPLTVLDYVVSHELAHLVHPDHSAKFWRHVESLFPDYKSCRAWLRRYGNMLSIDRISC